MGKSYIQIVNVKLEKIEREVLDRKKRDMAWASAEYHETINGAMTQVNKRLNFGMWHESILWGCAKIDESILWACAKS